jgi:hypothetical protein
MCRDLDPGQRLALRADLIMIPLREPLCDLQGMTNNQATLEDGRRRYCS